MSQNSKANMRHVDCMVIYRLPLEKSRGFDSFYLFFLMVQKNV